MKYHRIAGLLMTLAACAQGQEGGTAVDAPVQGQLDAPAADAPDTDAPDTDAAPTDAPVTDAAAIDAAAIDAAAIDAAAIDAPAIDAPATDAATDAMSIDGGVITAGDTCAQAQDITAPAMQGTGVVLTGNLTGYANNIQPSSACTGFTNDGPDSIYILTLGTAGRVITATVDAPWDSAVEIVQPCAMTPTCLIGRDAGNPESVTYTTTAAGTFYVIVDSWDPGAYGAYTLTVRVQ